MLWTHAGILRCCLQSRLLSCEVPESHAPGGLPTLMAVCPPLSESVTPGLLTPPRQVVCKITNMAMRKIPTPTPVSDFLQVPRGQGVVPSAIHFTCTLVHAGHSGESGCHLHGSASQPCSFSLSLSPKSPQSLHPQPSLLPPHQCSMVSECGQVWEAFLITVLICFRPNTGSFPTGWSCFSSRLRPFAHSYLVVCLLLTDLEESVTHSGH